jgi:hypothetical protein
MGIKIPRLRVILLGVLLVVLGGIVLGVGVDSER